MGIVLQRVPSFTKFRSQPEINLSALLQRNTIIKFIANDIKAFIFNFNGTFNSYTGTSKIFYTSSSQGIGLRHTQGWAHRFTTYLDRNAVLRQHTCQPNFFTEKR